MPSVALDFVTIRWLTKIFARIKGYYGTWSRSAFWWWASAICHWCCCSTKSRCVSDGYRKRKAFGISDFGNSYMFDEPSSYLDVKQRLNAARVIRSLISSDTYIIVVEHDLSVLDYLSDYICILYGMPSVYGVVTLPASVRDGKSYVATTQTIAVPNQAYRYQYFPRRSHPNRKPAFPWRISDLQNRRTDWWSNSKGPQLSVPIHDKDSR